MQFNDVDTLSIIIACLGHDVGHDGFSNGFHKNTNSQRKQLFGDSQIQEYYHAAQTLQILNTPEFDFISSKFSKEQVRQMKKRITMLILNTDMALMKDLR